MESKPEDSGEVHDYGESTATYQPVVRLEEKASLTGEEEEDSLFIERAKLYRFYSQTPEWKERGTGDVKILQHKETKKCRLLMRQEKTLKLVMNHYGIKNHNWLELLHLVISKLVGNDLIMLPGMQLRSNSDRSWLWSAPDYADGEVINETFSIRFKTPEHAIAFNEASKKAVEINTDLYSKHQQSEDDKPEEPPQSDKPKEDAKPKEEKLDKPKEEKPNNIDEKPDENVEKKLENMEI